MSKLLESKTAVILGLANKWSIAYAIAQLSMANTFIYLDAAHGGWLGWPKNLKKAVPLFKEVLAMAGGPGRIRGFATNVSNPTFKAWAVDFHARFAATQPLARGFFHHGGVGRAAPRLMLRPRRSGGGGLDPPRGGPRRERLATARCQAPPSEAWLGAACRAARKA